MAASCVTDVASGVLSCRDGLAATNLKLVSAFVIFFASITGISLPLLLARLFHGKPVYEKAVLIIKCFAAGVILSTSLVHVLPGAFNALADCHVASRHPWKDFPFSGLITLIGVLTALLVDLTASSHVDAHGHSPKAISEYVQIGAQVELEEIGNKSGGRGIEAGDDDRRQLAEAEELLKVKQKVVSQVLEIGIIFHSVIIGMTTGMSQNLCTIKPLVAALAFHQFFEGLGLGGCIAQAGFSFGTRAYMCLIFAVTTPMGIVMGMIACSVTGYDAGSPSALILEGLLGSLSSGILIYMALVDLIALDFFSHDKLMASE